MPALCGARRQDPRKTSWELRLRGQVRALQQPALRLPARKRHPSHPCRQRRHLQSRHARRQRQTRQPHQQQPQREQPWQLQHPRRPQRQLQQQYPRQNRLASAAAHPSALEIHQSLAKRPCTRQAAAPKLHRGSRRSRWQQFRQQRHRQEQQEARQMHQLACLPRR